MLGPSNLSVNPNENDQYDDLTIGSTFGQWGDCVNGYLDDVEMYTSALTPTQIMSSSVTIPAGQTSATITVAPFDDNFIEGNQTVQLTLSNSSAYVPNSQQNAATVTIADDTAATAPTNLTAAGVQPNQVNLSWTNNAANETGFQIDRATNSTFTQNLVTFTTYNTNTTYTDTTAADGTLYYYRVRAYNAVGQSANSTYSGTITPLIAPNAPTFTNIGSNQLTVSWTTNSATTTGYQVDRSLDGVNWTTNVYTGTTPPSRTPTCRPTARPTTTAFAEPTPWSPRSTAPRPAR